MVPFGIAGRARREGDQADVVGGGIDGLELRACVGDQRLERVGRAVTPIDGLLETGRRGFRLLHLVSELSVAERQRDLRLLDRIGQLLGAQQRHRRDANASGLDHRKIGCDHHRIVGRAQQHAPAGHETKLADQNIGDAIHECLQLVIAVADRGADNARRVAMALFDPAIEEIADAVQSRRILQLRPREDEIGPELARRQMLPCERIDMGRRSIAVRRARHLNLGGVGHRTLLCAWKHPASTNLETF
ncbi:hypothetical protein ACVJGC_006891 [Bradyrhizobium diazoefficiens]